MSSSLILATGSFDLKVQDVYLCREQAILTTETGYLNVEPVTGSSEWAEMRLYVNIIVVN